MLPPRPGRAAHRTRLTLVGVGTIAHICGRGPNLRTGAKSADGGQASALEAKNAPLYYNLRGGPVVHHCRRRRIRTNFAWFQIRAFWQFHQ